MKNEIMKFKILILILFGHTVCFAQDTKSNIEAVAHSFLDTIENHAYNSHMIDWQTFRPNFIRSIQKVEDEKSLLPYFQSVIDSLKDYHSAIFVTEPKKDSEGDLSDIEKEIKTFSQITDEQVYEGGYPKKMFESRMIENNYAYINVPGTMSENNKYINTIAEQLKNLDDKNPKAWIIDLTECWGGTTWAVVWNFLSLLDENGGFYVVNNKSEIIKNEIDHRKLKDSTEIKTYELVYKYNNLDKNEVISIKNNKVPIVFLTSGLTSSAGEMLVASFYGQSNVTTIGLKTGGLASGNEPYPVGDHFVINLMTSVIQDRKGKVYQIGEGIQPNIELPIRLSEYSEKPIQNLIDYNYAARLAKEDFIEGAVKYLNKILD